MKTTILLIRHAETVWNREMKIQGFSDSPLSKAGENQARKLGNFLKKEKLAAVYSSDLDRAIATAKLALGTEIQLTLLEDLRERNLGIWEGLKWDDISQNDPLVPRRYRRDPNFAPDQGETFVQLQDRVERAIHQIVKKHQGKAVAIFTSGGTIKAALTRLMKTPGEGWAEWSTWNTGVTTLEKNDEVWRVIHFNEIGHLR